ncbi:MAG: pantoate--beta-alanine ligase [Sphingomonadaceae bacterium]
MQTVSKLEVLRTATGKLRNKGEMIGFVPTMGALHDGHMALVRAAQEHADKVVVSIFVNPTQFGPNEDLDAYPRQMERDSQMLDEAGVDILWAPAVDVMYPQGFSTSIHVTGVSEGLCGASRPGHFDGVAGVVCKLFNQVQPDIAVFGEKDWQQLAVIRRMARDLDLTLPTADRIYGLPTIREPDGLAMSSRNRYLDDAMRKNASALPAQMLATIHGIENGASVAHSLENLQKSLLQAGFSSVDYAVLADAQNLEPLTMLDSKPARLLVAARIGTTRLIDNMAVGETRSSGQAHGSQE